MTVKEKMTRDELRGLMHDLLGLIAPEADFEELGPDTDIRFELDIDSFDFLNFLIGLNEKTGVEIPEADYGQLVSENDICTYILARL